MSGDDPAVEAFIAVAHQLQGFDPQMDPEWLDGYFTAVAASWRTIPLDEVIDRLDRETFERAFADPAEVQRACLALEGRRAMLAVELDPEILVDDPEPLRLSPVMTDWDGGVREEVVAEGVLSAEAAARMRTGEVWALGFLEAVEAFAADWPLPTRRRDAGPADELRSLIGTLELLLLEPDSVEARAFIAEQWKKDVVPTRDELVQEALFAAQDLRLFWLDHPPARPPRRAASAPGRNEPCPCGSGRKFKKCCGAA